MGDSEKKNVGLDDLDVKGARNLQNSDVELEAGHLTELEVDMGRVLAEGGEEGDWEADTSPFPQVRAVVPETDDPGMPVNTFRAWFLGIVSSTKDCMPGSTDDGLRYSFFSVPV